MEPATILGEDINFRGRLKFKNGLKILGAFQGTIETDGQLIIGESAMVKADIKAGKVQVGGVLRGNVNAGQSVQILKKGNIRGDIITPEIEIATGAKFTGACQME